MDEQTLKELLTAAREVPQMLGGEKKALTEEQVTIDFAFATAVTIKPVKAGECFTKENLWVKRPGTGEILAEHYEQVLGKRAICDIENDTQLRWDMIENGGN
jgi:sialic acid synthase SpsE